MKREFLQNFKVGDQPLPKEVIDAIMAETFMWSSYDGCDCIKGHQ